VSRSQVEDGGAKQAQVEVVGGFDNDQQSQTGEQTRLHKRRSNRRGELSRARVDNFDTIETDNDTRLDNKMGGLNVALLLSCHSVQR
jgi:hypothetical protein